jgi:FKBP-type peptidyl-prolyl cis-trans isomerase
MRLAGVAPRVPLLKAVLVALLLAPLAPGQPAGVGADPAQSAVVPSGSAPGPVPLRAYTAFGSSLAQSGHLAQLGWTDAQVNAFMEGMRAAIQGKPYPMDAEAQRLAAEVGRRLGELAAGEAQKAAAVDPRDRLRSYMRDMEKRLNLQETASGLAYSVQSGGNGVRPRPSDTIVLTCRATAPDGTTPIPQLSAANIRVRMDGMLPGLLEGLQMMTAGTQAVFVIPPALSFGKGPWPEGVPQGSPLVYWIALQDVVAAVPATR